MNRPGSLTGLKDRGEGTLNTGVILEGGLEIRIVPDAKPQAHDPLPLDIKDNRIILTAWYLAQNGQQPVIYVSKDIASRVKAESIGLLARRL